MTDNRATVAIGIQTNLFGRATNEVLRESSQTQRKFDVQRRMLEKERMRLLQEQRATKLRALIHDWSIGLQRYGVRHMATMDQVNEALAVPVLDRRREGGLENNVSGAVYKQDNGKAGEKFVSIGRVKSTREGSNGRQIMAWTMEKYFDIAKDMFDRMEKAKR